MLFGSVLLRYRDVTYNMVQKQPFPYYSRHNLQIHTERESSLPLSTTGLHNNKLRNNRTGRCGSPAQTVHRRALSRARLYFQYTPVPAC
jgi:hypothetical protein